jgi:hypothetical protein
LHDQFGNDHVVHTGCDRGLYCCATTVMKVTTASLTASRAAAIAVSAVRRWADLTVNG